MFFGRIIVFQKPGGVFAEKRKPSAAFFLIFSGKLPVQHVKERFGLHGGCLHLRIDDGYEHLLIGKVPGALHLRGV